MRKLKFLVFILVLAFLASCQEAHKESTKASSAKNENFATTNPSTVAVLDNSAYVTAIPKTKNGLVYVSWNAGNFGRSKSPEELAFMAKLLRNADIVALQEVSTADFGVQAVAKLSDELNRTGAKWDYSVSDPTHESAGKERFAFLWKTSRLKALPRKAVLIKSLENSLEREPSKLNFRIGTETVVVVSFHLVPTKKHPENEIKTMVNNSAEFSQEKMIVSGDFNLGHEKLNPIFEEKLKFQHHIADKTSLKSKISANGSYFAQEYDNIYTKGVVVSQAGIVDFVPSFSDLKEAKQISDHLPVFIVFTP